MFATRRVGGRGSSPRCGVVCTATNDVERRRPTASANTVGIPARGGDKKLLYGKRDGTAMVKETGFRRWGYGPRLPWEGCRVDRLCVMPRSRMLPTKRITRNPSPQLNYEATSGSVRPGLGSEVACLSAGHESLKMVNSCVASLLRAPLVLVLRACLRRFPRYRAPSSLLAAVVGCAEMYGRPLPLGLGCALGEDAVN